jgi:hypothetical protein
VVTDYRMSRAALVVDGQTLLEETSRAALVTGVSARLATASPAMITVRATPSADVQLFVNGEEVPPADALRAPISRSTWIHATIALVGSLFGFAAGWLYVRRAGVSGDPWAMKMATHMAGWHLLLVLTLFPASVWGQRAGIRAVQAVSLVFFLIHLGIAVANAIDASSGDGPWIAILNAASGVGFLAAVLYGQRAHADMDPLPA